MDGTVIRNADGALMYEMVREILRIHPFRQHPFDWCGFPTVFLDAVQDSHVGKIRLTFLRSTDRNAQHHRRGQGSGSARLWTLLFSVIRLSSMPCLIPDIRPVNAVHGTMHPQGFLRQSHARVVHMPASSCSRGIWR